MRKLDPFFLKLAGLFAVLACTSSCSHSLTQREFTELDEFRKRIYLTYYPEISEENRKELLDPETDPYTYLKSLGKNELFFKITDHKTLVFTAEPKNFRLRKLEIAASKANPIGDGTELELKATLHYQDGRKADVTRDVVWKALPELARLNENKLIFTCAHSPVVVTANFLGEAQGTYTVEFRKPIVKLSIETARSSIGTNETDYVSLEARASCQDGTESEVTCQGLWHGSNDKAAIRGCGHLQILSGGEKTQIEFEYGGKTVSKTIHLPPRRARSGQTP